LNPLSLQFVIWSQSASGPVLDIGCGEGDATIAVVARGGRVVAVDSDAAALQRLVGRVPTEQRLRLTARLGRLPNIEFKSANFAGIHGARELHGLDSESRQLSLAKFYRWLYPRGKLFVTVPATDCLDEQTLTRELTGAGFVIEGRTGCGVIARCAL
jgi:ubiquinone/menaquinone biosynthesis C-methylase UbiE